jgi:membrane-associated phospholipid phosphatase
MRSPRLATASWLAVLAAINVALFAAVAYVSIHTIRGQMLDTVALSGSGYGQAAFGSTLNTALNAVSVASLVLVLLVVGWIALLRARYSLAIMAVVLVAGSTLTTYVLKTYVITRTDLGVDPERATAGNSLPSGHATAAAAFAVGLVLVLPPAARGLASIIGATYAAVVGVATLSAGWHRPSDVIASYLIVGGWAAGAGLLLVLAQRPSAVVSSRDRAGWSLAATLLGGVGLLAAGVLALGITFNRMTEPGEWVNSQLHALGYLGSAVAITGSAYLMMAVVLSTVHQVVPHSKDGRLAVEHGEAVAAGASR